MKRHTFPGIALALCLLPLLMVACQSQPQAAVTTGLTSGELFQKAQDAADKGDYPLAMQYYTAFQEAFPQDTAHVAWSSYEIADLYHKMGKNETAVKLLKELIARAATAGDAFPAAVTVLSQELVDRLSPTAPSKP